MSKQTFYFSHDGNARNDDKLIAVRMRHGAEGYAVYFMILERLLESTDYMSVKDYNIIAFDLRVGANVVKSVIEDFGLFQISEDGKHFYSEKFSDRMIPLDNIREQRRLAGMKSAEKRAKIQQKSDLFENSSTTVQRPLVEKATEEKRVKEKEEIKKITTNVVTKESAADSGSTTKLESSFSSSQKQKPPAETPPPGSAAPPSTDIKILRDDAGVAICAELQSMLKEYYNGHPGRYPPEMYRKFLQYWSEPNTKNIPRWKTEKMKPKGRFDIPGRLATWNSNDQKFTKNGSNGNNTRTTPRLNGRSNSPLRPTGQAEPEYRGNTNFREIEID